MSKETIKSFANYEAFCSEVEQRANALAERVAKSERQTIRTRFRTMTAGPMRIHQVLFESEYVPGKFKQEHDVTSVYHEEQKRFVSARVMKNSVRLNKTQPKTPMALDCVQFESDTSPGLKGLSKDWIVYRVVSSSARSV